jgi:rare lipoprotein A (peptidoglycan hydrolase)
MKNEHIFVIRVALGIAVLLSLVFGLIGYILGRNYKEPEFLSPIPDEPQCIEYNIKLEPQNKTRQNSPIELQNSHNRGKASFYTNAYCEEFNPDCITASGEVFDDTKFTAACARNIPLGSQISVTYQDKSIIVTCNDRGSFDKTYGRVMDLSKAAFAELAPLSKGVIEVSFKEL